MAKWKRIKPPGGSVWKFATLERDQRTCTSTLLEPSLVCNAVCLLFVSTSSFCTACLFIPLEVKTFWNSEVQKNWRIDLFVYCSGKNEGFLSSQYELKKTDSSFWNERNPHMQLLFKRVMTLEKSLHQCLWTVETGAIPVKGVNSQHQLSWKVTWWVYEEVITWLQIVAA